MKIVKKGPIYRTSSDKLSIRIGKGRDRFHIKNADDSFLSYNYFCFGNTPKRFCDKGYYKYCLILVPVYEDWCYRLGVVNTLPSIMVKDEERLYELIELENGVDIGSDEIYPCYLLKAVDIMTHVTGIYRKDLSNKDRRIIERNIKKVKRKFSDLNR